MKKTFKLVELDCANCAAKMERTIAKIEGVISVNISFMTQKITIGIAMGALGSDAAIEAADVVLIDDAPGRIVEAICISRRTNAIVKQNIVFALTVKAIFLLLSILGIATLWEAVFADVGVSVIAILNAMRTLKPFDPKAPSDTE